MSRPIPAFVGLGSNVGDRRAHLEAALLGLARTPGVRVAAVSRAYENPAVGGPPQGDYWNAVAELETTLPAAQLLGRLHEIEEDEGRVRTVQDGPRTLDLDLVCYDETVEQGRPTLPHPQALTRAFVLRPWRDVAPETVVPGTNETVEVHDARLLARDPDAYAALRAVALLAPPAPAAADGAGRPVVLADPGALAKWRAGLKATVGFVPTMGALHEGHAALVRRARAECDVVVASIFVNPLQFGPAEDFSKYPRALEADVDLLAREGVDAVYAPTREAMYPEGFATTVTVDGPTKRFEGAARPGHFAGVATVVTKLLVSVRPARAYVGRKDAQQVAVLRRLATDLALPGRIVVVPTVRDLDGLALSSRNRYLSAADRATALAIPRGLAVAAAAAAGGERSAKKLVAAARRVLDASEGLTLDYLEVVDPSTFEPVARVAEPAALVVAAKVGATRLIDNERMVVPEAPARKRKGAVEGAARR